MGLLECRFSVLVRCVIRSLLTSFESYSVKAALSVEPPWQEGRLRTTNAEALVVQFRFQHTLCCKAEDHAITFVIAFGTHISLRKARE